jgi:hypothetical protein
VSEWYNSQKKSNGNFRKLLQERLDKVNPRRKLAKDETTKLAKLEGIAEKLKRGENVLSNISQNLYNYTDSYSKEMCDEII